MWGLRLPLGDQLFANPVALKNLSLPMAMRQENGTWGRRHIIFRRGDCCLVLSANHR